MDTGTVRAAMQRVAEAFPALAAEVGRQLSDAALARLFRSLVAEGVSIRDLRGVLEAAIDFDAVESAPHLVVLDERLPCPHAPDGDGARDDDDLAAFVRMQLRRAITASVRGERATLKAYLVDPELEDGVRAAAEAWRLRRRGSADDFVRWCARECPELLGDVRRAARKALGDADANRDWPILLTDVGVRAPLRRMLGGVCPRARLFAFEELVADTDIRPVGRLVAPANPAVGQSRNA